MAFRTSLSHLPILQEGSLNSLGAAPSRGHQSLFPQVWLAHFPTLLDSYFCCSHSLFLLLTFAPSSAHVRSLHCSRLLLPMSWRGPASRMGCAFFYYVSLSPSYVMYGSLLPMLWVAPSLRYGSPPPLCYGSLLPILYGCAFPCRQAAPSRPSQLFFPILNGRAPLVLRGRSFLMLTDRPFLGA